MTIVFIKTGFWESYGFAGLEKSLFFDEKRLFRGVFQVFLVMWSMKNGVKTVIRYSIEDGEIAKRAVGEALLGAWGRWARQGDEARKIGRTGSILRVMAASAAKSGFLRGEDEGGKGILKASLDDAAPLVDAVLAKLDDPRRRALAVIVYQRGYRGAVARQKFWQGTGEALSPKAYRCALEALRRAVYAEVEAGV